MKATAIRKKEEESNVSDEDTEPGSNLADKLFEQSLRKRQNGVTPEALTKASQKTSSAVAEPTGERAKIMEGINVPNSSNQYEKLMEKFVDDKMKDIIPELGGCSDGSGSSGSGDGTVDNKSLLLSTLLETTDTKEGKSQMQEQRFVGLGVGLDEVILPSSYKIDNEKETQEIRTKRREVGYIAVSKSSAAFATEGDQFINPYSAVAKSRHGLRFGSSFPVQTEAIAKDSEGQPSGSALAVAASGNIRSSGASADYSGGVPTVPRPEAQGSDQSTADPELWRNIYVDPTIKAREAEDRKRKSNEDATFDNFRRRERMHQHNMRR